jgi:hypothetical protein
MNTPDPDPILPPKHGLYEAEKEWNTRFDEPHGACLSGTLGCGFAGLLILIALLGLCSCGPSRFTADNPNETSDVRTVRHDGHLFVLYEGIHQGNVIHHPGCPCLKH